VTFLSALKVGDWKPIPDCPGRYVLWGVSPTLGIDEIIGQVIQIRKFHSPLARDEVFVACIEGGGWISYRQSKGNWVHTLCNDDGFRRKLEQLQIILHR